MENKLFDVLKKSCKLPLEETKFKSGNSKVLVFTKDEKYTDSFGYQWNTYVGTHKGGENDPNFWKKRLEFTLAMPLENLKGKVVLEIGCGAGRFTVPLANYAKEVIAVDLSEAIYYNLAHKMKNVTLVKSDLFDLPEFNKVDVVICRGVVQHTPNPRKTLKKLFTFAKEDSLVIFDVYKKIPFQSLTFKYFYRSFLPKIVSYKKFDNFSRKNRTGLYKALRFSNKIGHIPIFGSLFRRTPLFFREDYNEMYKNFSKKEREEVFLSHFIDGIYSTYDNPMTDKEIISTLAQIGQYPYSYDRQRNIFRYKKSNNTKKLKNPKFTKHGVQWKV